MNDKQKRTVKSYVLRQGRMTDAQQQAMSELWPKYGLSLLADKTPFSQQAIFGRKAPLILEIGFGMGTSLAAMAKEQPEIDYLGIEVHRPGVGRLMHMLEENQSENVRIFHEDAITVLEQILPESVLSGVQLFFPDPWPKKKHHKRRIVQPAFLTLLASKLQQDGFVHFATDWQPYAEHMAEVLEASEHFVNAKESSLYKQLVTSRPGTRFEHRGKKLGHDIFEFVYQKVTS